MGDLSEWYGELVSEYSGIGTLNGAYCDFEIGQIKDGTIVLHCSAEARLSNDTNQLDIELTGTSLEGESILARGNVTNSSGFQLAGFHYTALGPFEYTVGDADWTRAHEARFAVTNFLFGGLDERFSRESKYFRNLDARVDDFDISFQKRPTYGELTEVVGMGKRTEITCEMVVEVGSHSRDEIARLSYAVCDLLTIAKGKIVNWIKYEVYDANQSLVFTYAQNRYTNRNSGATLIDFHDHHTALEFLEQCYPAYQRYNARNPGMLHRIGRLLLDVSLPEFEQTSALVVFSIVDALSKKDSCDREFRKRIEHLRDAYSVCLDDNEIDLFVKSRNSVVHELQFHTKDGKSEYARNLSILHRLLLRILDYRSEYYDYSQLDTELRKATL